MYIWMIHLDSFDAHRLFSHILHARPYPPHTIKILMTDLALIFKEEGPLTMEGGGKDASSVVSSSTLIPGPITLSPPGEREVVDKARALEIIAHWREQLLAHRAKVVATSNPAANTLPLCDTIVLADKSYTHEAAMEISTFLTSTTEFDPSIASGITVADVSDVIARYVTLRCILNRIDILTFLRSLK